jgi:hypothetical protein
VADFAGVNREPGLLALLLQAFVVDMGRGRIVALYCRSSSSYQIC